MEKLGKIMFFGFLLLFIISIAVMGTMSQPTTDSNTATALNENAVNSVIKNTESKYPDMPEAFGRPVKYTAAKNISVYDLARKNTLAIEHVLMANNTNAMTVSAGKTVVLPKFWIAPLIMEKGLVLNLPERAVYVYKNWKVISVYPVAIGALGWNTPTGNFSIISKTKDPIWFPPAWAGINHPVYPGPHNPLGDRWMGITGGYGMHATNAPSSIGSAASHGCIRMYPECARALFEQTYVGMPVKIIYETVKIGFEQESGKFYLSVFPDIYSYGTNSASAVWKKLENSGLAKFVDEKQLAKMLREKRGMPEALFNSGFALKINNEPAALKVAPIVKDNEVYAESEFFNLLGFQVNYDAKTKSVELTRYFDKITAPINANYAYINNKKIDLKIPPKLVGGCVILPVNILSEFGFALEKEDKELAYNVTKSIIPNLMQAMEGAAFGKFAANVKDSFMFKKKTE